MAEHVALLRSSQSGFIQELFAESEADSAAVTASGKPRHATRSAFKLNSVGAQFRKQLQVHYDSQMQKAGPCAFSKGMWWHRFHVKSFKYPPVVRLEMVARMCRG